MCKNKTNFKNKLSLPKILGHKLIAKTALFCIEQIQLRFSNGNERVYERLTSHSTPKQAVMIIPFLDEKRFIMIEEYAVGTHSYQISLPKGLVEDNETLKQGALRELKEEAGYGAKKIEYLTELSLSPNYMTHKMQVVVAKGLYPEKLIGDEPEPLGVKIFHLDDLTTLAKRNDFNESRALAALYLVKEQIEKNEQQKRINQIKLFAKQAGTVIYEFYQEKLAYSCEEKADQTPLTLADKVAHYILVTGLQGLTPEIPIISEEAEIPSFSERKTWPRYWLVDPLDGTREFLNKTDEFTINIALVEKGKVTLGLIYAPVLDCFYWGDTSLGAWKQNGTSPAQSIQTRKLKNQATVLASRSWQKTEKDKWYFKLKKDKPFDIVVLGSALKFCKLAEGLADFYPRVNSGTCEWDIAAGQAIIEAAGGKVVDASGRALRYNIHKDMKVTEFYAYGNQASYWQQIL